MTTPHLLLVSEDRGNAHALQHVQHRLTSDASVTWICSTPSSQEFTELGAASALKNQHMGKLNLLVITRNERQPFDVLTGQLDNERLQHCLSHLLNPKDITEIAIAAEPARQDTLSQWLEGSVQGISSMHLKVEVDDPELETEPEIAPEPGIDRVAVSIIMQGREFSFDMPKTAGTLLDGAEDAGIDLPFSCRGGVCSTCRAKLKQGDVELVENYALEDWELEAGFTLPCQAEPLSAKITLDYDEV
jgi:ring-1,2-phenylacetyl-CoA epoxidase subunit PaaE